VPDTHQIFFFAGGATMQYTAIIFNLLGEGENKTANYLVTGHWSQGCYNEACKYFKPNLVHSNAASKNRTILDPAEWSISQDASYFYYCANETVHGLEFNPFPYHLVPKG
jgi:phosphoserine aminotransferase